MKIKFLGIGGGLSFISSGNTNMLFEEDGKFMAFDLGRTAPDILVEQLGFDLGDLDALYITHEHSDHVGGVELLAFYRYFYPNKTGKTVRPKLFISSNLIQPLWDNTLKGGLDCHHGKIMSLTDYFECFPIRKSKSFEWQGIKFTPVQTTHVNAGMYIKHSYGLLIENPKTGKTTFITGDSCFSPDTLNFFYEKADYIFQDCENSPKRSRVHAHLLDLETLAPEIKRKMYLCHHTTPVEAPSFAGFVEKFQEFEV